MRKYAWQANICVQATRNSLFNFISIRFFYSFFLRHMERKRKKRKKDEKSNEHVHKNFLNRKKDRERAREEKKRRKIYYPIVGIYNSIELFVELTVPRIYCKRGKQAKKLCSSSNKETKLGLSDVFRSAFGCRFKCDRKTIILFNLLLRFVATLRRTNLNHKKWAWKKRVKMKEMRILTTCCTDMHSTFQVSFTKKK